MVNKINNNKDLIALSGLISFVVVSGLFLSSSLVSADDSTVATATVTVPAACTMSGTGMNSHTAEIPNGTYQANIGTTTLHAFCNDANGFAIYAAGYTGNEIGGTNSNKLVGTAATNNATIVTGLATSTPTPDVSNWAMKLAIQSDSGNTTGTNAVTIDSDTEGSFANYHTVPNEYKKVAHKNTATDMTASTGGVKLTTTYAAYISRTQPADTYTGQVIYTLVHPANHAAPVVYNTKADDISEVTYLQEFAKVSDENREAIVASMVPEQQYTLTDARDNKTYTIAKYIVGSAPTNNQYAVIAGEYLTSCEESTCDSTLYMQLPSDWKTFVDSCNGVMEDCNMNLWPNEYDVWMTKNLDLDLDSSITYTNEDTDLGYNVNTGQYDVASWSPTHSTYVPTSTHVHEWCQGGTWNSQNGYCELNNTPESYDPGNLYWNGLESGFYDWGAFNNTCDYSTSAIACDQSLNPISSYVSSTGINQYHLGNYYNWPAALATNDSSEFYPDPLVEQSICPTGWTLPRSNYGKDSFYSLWNQYALTNDGYGSYNDVNNNGIHDTGEYALWTSPLYINVAGYFDGFLDDVGVRGSLWSPNPDGVSDARYSLFTIDSIANPSSFSSQGIGYSVRCILRPVASNNSGGGAGGEIPSN